MTPLSDLIARLRERYGDAMDGDVVVLDSADRLERIEKAWAAHMNCDGNGVEVTCPTCYAALRSAITGDTQ